MGELKDASRKRAVVGLPLGLPGLSGIDSERPTMTNRVSLSNR
jgi:hypothetical protein